MAASATAQVAGGKGTYAAQLAARRKSQGIKIAMSPTSDNATTTSPAARSMKRKVTSSTDAQGLKVSKPGEAHAVDTNAITYGEKRPKRFRARPTVEYGRIEERAISQRMFVLNRERGGTDDCPSETMTIAGSTGNLYTVFIGQTPSCNCPHRAAQCKHIVYALIRVLHAPDDLRYQLAFLQGELRELFANAPPIALGFPTTTASSSAGDAARKAYGPDEDCPICCMPLEEPLEEIVYCKAACGNNLHAICFKQWEATKRQARSKVTCPFCRTPWKEEHASVADACKNNAVNDEGYINIATELGMSGRRDYSTYHRVWVHQQARHGVDVGGSSDHYPW